MRFVPVRFACAALAASLVVACMGAFAQEKKSTEDAYRANNLGVALLEQFKYREGADAFQRALKLDPKLALARTNLAVALYNVPDLAGAERAARAALELAPKAPTPHYILGLVYRTQNKQAEAIAEFKKVLEVDPGDVGANVNLGQIYAQDRKFEEAAAVFKAAVDAEPYNITGVYNYANALNRTGNKAEGAEMLKRFQALRTSGAGTSIGPNYLEQGRYAEAVASTGIEPGVASTATPKARFTLAADAIPAASLDAAATVATLFDADADGDLDLFAATAKGERLFRNDAGRFVDVTAQSGIAAATMTAGAVAGDFDNDEKPDLFVFRDGSLALYRNLGGLKFEDATKAATVPPVAFSPRTAAFVDVDHDGDLDVAIAGTKDGKAAPPALFRNTGDAKFADVSTESKVAAVPLAATAIVPTDFDNRRDVDLVVGGNDGVRLLRNLRDTTFREVAGEVGIAPATPATSLASGDLNNDGYTDLFLGNASGEGHLAVSDGKTRFALVAAPAALARAASSLMADYDDDGLLDVVAATPAGLAVARNVGGELADATSAAVAKELADAKPEGVLGAGDLDRDGDTDLVVRCTDGRLVVATNDGGNANRSITVDLTGRVSNRSGIGARVEARAGSLLTRREYVSASPATTTSDVVLGLGPRPEPDAVRILWPTGIVQAETSFPVTSSAARTLDVTELDRKPSSCPFLYVWNGERFEFVTDFMGGGEMGYWHGPNSWSKPDPDEYVRIPDGLLVERNGRYELRITNELEEVLFVDDVQLVAVDHPAVAEIYPDEGLRETPPDYRLYAARDAAPPRYAVDGDGRDWTASVARLDRDFVKGFALHKIRGYAEPHTLTLGIGPERDSGTLLLLTGWTDYAFSSDNVAGHQAGLTLVAPKLEAKSASGEWVEVIPDLGIPVGRPQTIVADLTGRLPHGCEEVRISTNMRIFWDRILVANGGLTTRTREMRLTPLAAELRWRGYSTEQSPDGVEPWSYDYDRVTAASPWKVFAGRYTREGDVRELLDGVDDMFVVSRTGDEIALSFDASQLPTLRDGWHRTFLLYATGYSKEMDPNSASPHRVEPLPFARMSGYPYNESEHYPLTPEHRRYLERYNTRVVASPVPAIETTVGTGGIER